MLKKYSDEFLILELHRFVNQNDRVPTFKDMQGKFGYPSNSSYVRQFGTWNKALEAAGLELNQYQDHWQDGTETCSYCGCTIEETSRWFYVDNKRYCMKHGNSGRGGLPDYATGNLDINSSTGLGRAGEILVVKTLEIGKEHDCNRKSCNYSFDLYNEKYGKIDVKTALFSSKNNRWGFLFRDKEEANTYICIGLSLNRKQVEHVWIVPNEDEIKNLITLNITNSHVGLSNRKHLEINSRLYNEMWQTMKLDNCKIMSDKSKDDYIKPMKLNSVVDNVVKQVEQVIDVSQYRLIDFM